MDYINDNSFIKYIEYQCTFEHSSVYHRGRAEREAIPNNDVSNQNLIFLVILHDEIHRCQSNDSEIEFDMLLTEKVNGGWQGKKRHIMNIVNYKAEKVI